MSGDRRARWAILGTGKIARIFGAAMRLSSTGELVAVGSRSAASADRFGQLLDVPRRHASYAAALADADVDVVYIATPHTTHADLIAEAARHGKHILCEKPLAVTEAEARYAIDVVRQHRVFLMEAFAFRCHPQTARLVSLIRNGAVGELRMLEAAFGYDAGPSPRNYLLDRELAGGSILDVGCYTVAMARLVAGVALGQRYREPVSVTGAGHVCDAHGVDHRAAGTLVFEGGLVAQLSCAIDADLGSRLRVVGSEGTITLTDPWLPGRGRSPTITLARRSDERVWQLEDNDPDLYAAEADEVARRLEHRESPAMALADSVGNMQVLDHWRRAVGVCYRQDAAPTSDGAA